MKRVCVISMSLLILTSCGTITGGTSQTVSVNTEPSGAKVTIDGMKKVSPAMFDLSPKANGYIIEVEKKGYVKTTDKVNARFDGVTTILGNIPWLLFGAVIDLVTGAAYDLDDSKNIELEKK